jgi:hypothetical protein
MSQIFGHFDATELFFTISRLHILISLIPRSNTEGSQTIAFKENITGLTQNISQTLISP